MLTLEINGVLYKDAQKIQVFRSLKNFCGFFTATTTANPQNVLPVFIGQTVKVYADDILIFNGYIEQLSPNYTSSSHTISISGRDRTQDVYDSTVSGKKSFEGVNSYTNILRQVLDAGNLQDIKIIDEVNNIPDFSDTDIVSADVGQTIFDFIEPYSRKNQFLITTNEDGNILLMRAGTERLGISLLHEIGNNENNVLEATLEIDNSKRFNKYVSKSNLNPFNEEVLEPADLVNQTSEQVIDSKIRNSRVLEFNTEEDMDLNKGFNRAKFEANIRRANSLNYSCVVQGNSFNGNIFKINRKVFVKDTFCQISSDMLIHTVNYNFSIENGSTTQLQLSAPDAYSLQAEQEAREANRSDLGGGFV